MCSVYCNDAGGLSAVIWTDAIQVVIMLAGAFVLMIMAFLNVGGYSKLKESYMAGVGMPPPPVNGSQVQCTQCTTLCMTLCCAQSCIAGQQPRADAYRMLRAVDADLPWVGMTFGLTISAVWYWCSDQVLRVCTACSMRCAYCGCCR